VTKHGGKVVVEPFDAGDAGRTAVCADPEGAEFRLWQGRRRAGAELVNAPGSWNFSELHARDASAASAFYAAVFGWEADAFDLGGPVTLFRLPGYGDFLAQHDPEIRERQAAEGAPSGFADAVAWMMPLTDGEPARWTITFAVDGTDAIVERAQALGGRVVVPPYDAPPVRAAVIADPAGAVFTASTYDPTMP
jgi:predicted enzyme related to lactoylglutathione lyase